MWILAKAGHFAILPSRRTRECSLPAIGCRSCALGSRGDSVPSLVLPVDISAMVKFKLELMDTGYYWYSLNVDLS